MASATSFSVMETSKPDINNAINTDNILTQATSWADKLRNLLSLVAPYGDSDDAALPASMTIDESIMNAPRRRAADPIAAAVAEKTAELLYPAPDHSLGCIIKYEKDVVRLRKYVIQQRKRQIEVATRANELQNWGLRIMNQGPWDPIHDPVSLNGAPSLPMPVQIAEPSTLEPFFEHLRRGGTEDISSSIRAADDAIEMEEEWYGTKSLEFEKGVVYADRRMDLCKMVLGPTNIGDLLESLKTNEFITHFLLGNNIIGPHGAKCIADFLKEYPNRMDTWYLAGNCINTKSFGMLVDEWIKSTSVTNIWLKRNPLETAAAEDVFRLITETPNLRTLDLDQTKLGDVGVAHIFSELAKHDKPLALRHIYMNADGIGFKGATAIKNYLASPHCTLQSLYISNNPLGSAGVEALAAGLIKNKSLHRLTLASVGLTDDGASTLCSALCSHPSLTTLDLGQSYATPDLGSRYNWITDRSVSAIHDLILSCPTLTFLNLSYTSLSPAGLNEILRAIIQSPTLQYYFARTVYPQGKSAIEVAEGQKYVGLAKQGQSRLAENVKKVYGAECDYEKFLADEKRWLVNDKQDVRKIDSVYRNRDAGMARKGLKKLEKWWDEEDETLEEVMKAVGPVCTMKKGPVRAVGPVCTMRKAKAQVVDAV
ncbi:hypothetical protein B0J11DRAFT_539378 [Dendryphion nanum]|uniref:RNI-like protein n=1 Tax=Dendryphion nanum TaxID=256645 RepID=A0A9P9IC69_9PLEO|nr:hypothetical protein B0J11DRAFT_539378 [Dendryphion nanum]